MPYCFAPGCTSGYKSNQDKITLFSVPKDEATFMKWQKAIPRADKVLQKNSKICSLHFNDDMINDKFSFVIDGEVQHIERKRTTLHEHAIPCKFPNLPSYLTIIKKIRKPPKERWPTHRDKKPQKPTSRILHVGKFEPDMICSGNENSTFPIDKNNFSRISDASCVKVLPASNDSDTLINCSSDENLQQGCDMNNNYTFANENNNFSNTPDVPSIKIRPVDKPRPISNGTDIFMFSDKENLAQGCDSNRSYLFLSDVPSTSGNKNVPCNLVPCKGINTLEVDDELEESILYSKKCFRTLLISKNIQGSGVSYSQTCKACQKKRKDMVQQKKHKLRYLQLLKNQKRRNITISKKMQKMKQQLKNNEFKFINNLPHRQQLVVNHFIRAGKTTSSKIKYEKKWLLECIIMKMKSPKLYRHLRSNLILPLPTLNLLNKRLKDMRSGFGICHKKMEAIKLKVNTMDDYMRHGNLVIDEMKLREALNFSKATCEVTGLVDLGNFTPPHQAASISDHGLIIMFQPYAGNWKQVIGVYASRNNCDGETLSKVILDAVICCENSGLCVDGITCDGASWNRKMFLNLGGGLKDNGDLIHKVIHPCDQIRFLHFFSDFPHLIKCFRNKFLKDKVFETQKGTIHSAVIKHAIQLDLSPFKLRAMPGIGISHVEPDNFQKMKVSLAMQLFGEKVQAGIALYKEQLIPSYGLDIINNLLNFLSTVNDVIKIMTSRFSNEALYKDSNDIEVLENFLVFLTEWEQFASIKAGGYITRQTSVGLKMTILSTISLLKYLTGQVGYKYLLTSRVSQDCIENFFGLVRAASPTNDHPSPTEFLSIVEVLSTCSILKPISLGNYTPCDFTSLLSYSSGSRIISDRSTGLSGTQEFGQQNDHTYFPSASHAAVNSYFAGFVARKFLSISNCHICSELLVSEQYDGNNNFLIQERDKGGLIYPSDSVSKLVKELDILFIGHCAKQEVTRDIYGNLLSMVHPEAHSIGCKDHKKELTKKVAAFVLMCRLAFYLKNINNSKFDTKKFVQYGKLRKL